MYKAWCLTCLIFQFCLFSMFFLLYFFRFVCKNNGVLFENDLIQIGVKSEFRQNLGRIGLFYGNKTQLPLTNFQPEISWSEENQAKLSVQVKSVDRSNFEISVNRFQIFNISEIFLQIYLKL